MSYLSKIWRYFTSDQEKKTNNTYNNGSITFCVDDNKKIKVIMNLPLINNDIIEKSEDYANMILNITNGYANKELASYLQNNSIDTKNDEEKLLIDNIIYFWSVLTAEHHKYISEKIKLNEPVIKPSQVFITKN